jgi:hypothetical protein
VTVSKARAEQALQEQTGITFGVLAEDFVVTARLVGKPYCRVFCEDLGWTADTGTFPLVYVPFTGLGFALKKGDPVSIKFNLDDLRFPYLWQQDPKSTGSMSWPIPSDNAPTGTGVAFPTGGPDEYTFNVLSTGLITASNGVYDVIRRGDKVIFMWNGGITVYAATGDIGLKTGGGYIKIASAGTVNINGHLTVGV